MKSVFGSVESRKHAILEVLPLLNFSFGKFLYFVRVEIYKKKKIQKKNQNLEPLKLSKMAVFEPLQLPN